MRPSSFARQEDELQLVKDEKTSPAYDDEETYGEADQPVPDEALEVIGKRAESGVAERGY